MLQCQHQLNTWWPPLARQTTTKACEGTTNTNRTTGETTSGRGGWWQPLHSRHNERDDKHKMSRWQQLLPFPPNFSPTVVCLLRNQEQLQLTGHSPWLACTSVRTQHRAPKTLAANNDWHAARSKRLQQYSKSRPFPQARCPASERRRIEGGGGMHLRAACHLVAPTRRRRTASNMGICLFCNLARLAWLRTASKWPKV